MIHAAAATYYKRVAILMCLLVFPALTLSTTQANATTSAQVGFSDTETASTQAIGPLVSGGGCTEDFTPQPPLPLAGWDIGVCISNRHTATQVFPDIYVNHTAFIPPACTIDFRAFDSTIQAWARRASAPCATGHYQIPQFNATPGHTYETYAFVVSAGGPDTWLFGPSPGLTF